MAALNVYFQPVLCDSREFLDLIKLFLVKSEKIKIKSFILLDAIGLDSITLQN